MHTFGGIRKIEFLRKRMIYAAEQYGSFTNPEVLQISRDLDECILMIQRTPVRRGDGAPIALSAQLQ